MATMIAKHTTTVYQERRCGVINIYHGCRALALALARLSCLFTVLALQQSLVVCKLQSSSMSDFHVHVNYREHSLGADRINLRQKRD